MKIITQKKTQLKIVLFYVENKYIYEILFRFRLRTCQSVKETLMRSGRVTKTKKINKENIYCLVTYALGAYQLFFITL